jgi:pyruvate/2-oxoacid:ferredoxin oxidoreductase alpha subunit
MEMEPGCAVQWEGEPKSKTVFVVWGGAAAPLRWALNRLGKNGEASVASLRSLQPFLSPESYGDFALCENLVTVESTAGEPLARWLRMAVGVQAKKSVRLDGAQEGEQTLQKIKEAFDGG